MMVCLKKKVLFFFRRECNDGLLCWMLIANNAEMGSAFTVRNNILDN